MLGIRQKLFLGFGVVLAAVLAQSVVTYWYTAQSERLVVEAIEHDFQTSQELAKIAVEGQAIRRFEKEYFIYVDDREKRKKYFEEWKGAYNRLDRAVEGILADTSGRWSAAERAEVTRWKQALDEYGRGFFVVDGNVEAGSLRGTLAANSAIHEAKEKFKPLLDGAIKMGAAKHERARRSAAEIKGNFGAMNAVLLLAAGVSAAIVALLLVVVPGAIARPIAALTHAADAMSSGNLETAVPAPASREFGVLAASLERLRVSQKVMLDRLRSRG